MPGLNPYKWADGDAWDIYEFPPTHLPSLPAGVAVLGPTLLVSCEHPHFDVSLLETLDGFKDAILEPVFNGCGSQQLGVEVGAQGTD